MRMDRDMTVTARVAMDAAGCAMAATKTTKKTP